MGVLPLQFTSGQNAGSLGLAGDEVFNIEGVDEALAAGGDVRVRATKADRSAVDFSATARIDTPSELETFRNGGILHMVLRRLIREGD
jgi:aconitate hydratase